jgi:colanic acid/amylovoran biosynthesis glycosyltransferase
MITVKRGSDLKTANTIAYLAPEIPALSATFVYEEMLALERRGYRIVPFSVRYPENLATDQQELASHIIYIYEKSKLQIILMGAIALIRSGARLPKALSWLLSDILASGWLRLASWKLVFQFLAGARLARNLVKTGCSHLHIHFAHTPAQIGMYASALSGIPFTITAHANDIFERGMLLPQKAERALRLLTISDHNRDYLSKLGIPPAKLAVVRCGVSLPQKLKAEFRPSGRPLRIGALGRMVEKKGFDVLLNAAKILTDSGMQLELHIAGDGPMLNSLKQLAVKLGIDDATHFEGSLPHSKVAAWLQTLDVFALSCKMDRSGDMDGIPVVLMEAMSQFVPVISTRISGIPELVVDGVTGLLAAPNDCGDLARQIRRIAESPSLSATLVKNAVRHVVGEFGQEVNLDRLIAAFKVQHSPAQ